MPGSGFAAGAWAARRDGGAAAAYVNNRTQLADFIAGLRPGRMIARHLR
jgi:hypothetical protein